MVEKCETSILFTKSIYYISQRVLGPYCLDMLILAKEENQRFIEAQERSTTAQRTNRLRHPRLRCSQKYSQMVSLMGGGGGRGFKQRTGKAQQ